MSIKKIHHVAYRCINAKETVEWYAKHLNMNFVLAIAEDEVLKIVQVLKAVIFDAADHEERNSDHADHDRRIGEAPFSAKIVKQQHPRGHDSGAARYGQAVEDATVDHADLDIEPGQTKGPADEE